MTAHRATVAKLTRRKMATMATPTKKTTTPAKPNAGRKAALKAAVVIGKAAAARVDRSSRKAAIMLDEIKVRGAELRADMQRLLERLS